MGEGDADVALRGGIDASVISVVDAGLPFALTGLAAARHAARCEQALATLGEGDSLHHVKLLASRAVALAQSHHDLGADAAALAAADMAVRLGDAVARGYALAAKSLAHPMPEHTDARLAAAREILDIASCHDERALVPVGYLILLVALLEKGQIRSLDIELTGRSITGARFPDLVDGEPAAWFRCLRAILDGDTGLAEELVERQLVATGAEDPHALGVYKTQMGIISWMRGSIDDAENIFLAARRLHPEQVLWSASLAWLWVNQGRRASAEALFDSLQNLDEIPRDRYWLSTLTVMAEAATKLGPRSFAEELRERLLPFADHLVPAGIGVAFWGTAARTLGLLEERLGMLDEARKHLELAVTLTGRIGAQAWMAEAQIELAEFAFRHDIGDIPAYELIAEAKRTCLARGFPALAIRANQRPRVRVMGRFEVVSHDGVQAQWTSRKARELLKMLVAARGVGTSREVFMHALWPDTEPALLANRFSVAVSAIRRALDPNHTFSRQHHLVVDGDSLRLDLQNVDVDLERFLAVAQQPNELSRRAAEELYRGGAFPDEPYADWAAPIRDYVDQVWATLNAP